MCAVTFFCATLVFGETKPVNIEPLTVPTYFRHVGVADGLSQVTVADIIQDRQGFIWLATQNGINRYDGYNFAIFKKDRTLDGSGPIGEFAYKLLLDPTSDDIWIATSGGLSRYQYASNSFKHYNLTGSDGEQRFIVPSVTADQFGQVWVGTRHGLFRYQEVTDSFVSIDIPISPTAWVLDVDAIAQDIALVATTEGLLLIDTTGRIPPQHSLVGTQVTDIERLHSGDFWFSTLEQGVQQLRVNDFSIESLEPLQGLPAELTRSGVNAIKQLRNGDIWISAMTGLRIMRQDDLSQAADFYFSNNGASVLSSAHMTRTFESQSGLIWQGTWTGGFSIFDPNSLQIKSLNAAPNTWVRGLAFDDTERLWFGTAAGIWYREVSGEVRGPLKFPTMVTDKSMSAVTIRSLTFDQQNRQFWVGTTTGVYHFDVTQPRLQPANFLSDANVFHIAYANGELWIGTFNSGLYRISVQSGEILEHWEVATVAHSLVTHPDFVLAGTIEGLLKIDKTTGAITNLHDNSRPAEQRSPRVVTWISQVNASEFLLGTQGSGIYAMRLKANDVIEFEALYPDSHLASLSIGGIQLDAKGDLWASTTEGIAHVNAKTGNISYFNKKNGAFTVGYYINHSVKASNGQLVFAGPRGISHFYPEQIGVSQWQPNVVLTNLLVLNKPVSATVSNSEGAVLDSPIHIAKRINLAHSDNVFSIEFSALDYASPETNQYAFKLDGFDQDWNTAIARHRVATYTNLDPGRYQLQVRGTNKDGVWSQNSASIEIVVTPPWYWNTWSKVLWLMLTLLLVSGVYKWRVWDLQKRSDKLKRLVEKRTQDLEDINRKLLRLSSIDELTGLRNRRDFRIHAELELDRFKRLGSPFSILMIDIDHFKQINDTLGHACGDRVLVECAQMMTQLTRKHDLLARWGGEEFILLAVNTDLTAAVATANKIRQAIHELEVNFEQQVVKVTMTVGVSQIMPDQNLDECIKIADGHLYEGKRKGRDITCY